MKNKCCKEPRFVVCFILPQIKERFMLLRSAVTFFLNTGFIWSLLYKTNHGNLFILSLLSRSRVKACIARIRKTSSQNSLNSYIPYIKEKTVKCNIFSCPIHLLPCQQNKNIGNTLLKLQGLKQTTK